MRRNDTMLLESAYNSVLLRSQVANLTIPQLHYVIENATNYELDVIEEGLGGLGNLFKAGKSAVKTGVQAVGQAAAGAGQAVKGAAQQAGRAVAGAGSAVKAGAQQVGSNVNKMYQTGQRAGEAEQRRAEVAKLVDSLAKQLEALKQANPDIGSEFDDVTELTIGEIQRKVQRGFASNRKTAADARKGGFFKGVQNKASKAFNQTYNQQQ
jgi:hypothetical protein